MDNIFNFPPQQLPFRRKNVEWRKKHLDWADSKSFFNYNTVRKSVIHKKINYDLVNGILHMKDLMSIVNPEDIKASYVPNRIQHYPIMNSKLNVLRGEESSRQFDYKVIVTNPNAISEIENTKKQELQQAIQGLIENPELTDEQFNQGLQDTTEYYTYEWQDEREVRANALLNHYVKEYNIPLMFTNGFMDAMTVGEEIYRCDIIGGEPTIEKLNPLKVRIFRSGYSNKIEDADVIVYEDYWSPGRVIDTFYDELTPKDRKYIEESPGYGSVPKDAMDNIDERYGFISSSEIGEKITAEEGFFWSPLNGDGVVDDVMPFDMYGNIKVLKIYWKSRRKIKKVKSYNPETGAEEYNFYSEDYTIDESLGEEEQTFWINEAWEGTKIGDKIYIGMRPRPVQYNTLSNPSRCHFGIVGSIYNLNENKPFSMVDMMKPYSYLYDVIHDRLNKLIARNWGPILQLDLAKVPKGWDIDKWLHYAKINGIAVSDSFKEGNIGAATGKLAGGMNNNSTGVINAEVGNSIQQYMNLLEFIKNEMAEVSGISKQREGQVSNRETVGGVERATLQSSHITEWLFGMHNDVRKRALECFLETAKIALRGHSKKFQYLLSDNSLKVMEIDGDLFSENDYGLVVDNSNNIQDLNQKLDTLAQAALQNQAISFSAMMKLYNSTSLAEKQRMIEKNEQEMQQRAEQQQQQQLQQQQQIAQMQMQQAQAEMQQKDLINQRDNETKIVVAQINSQAEMAMLELKNGMPEQEPIYSEEAKAKLKESMRQFDEKLKLEKERLAEDKRKNHANEQLKSKQISKQSKTLNNK